MKTKFILILCGLLIALTSCGGDASSKVEKSDVDASPIKLLMCVASIDGNFDDSESLVIAALSQKMGFSQEDVLNVAQEIDEQNYDNLIPENGQIRDDIIELMAAVAKADGTVSDKEISIIKDLAKPLGITESSVEDLLKQ